MDDSTAVNVLLVFSETEAAWLPEAVITRCFYRGEQDQNSDGPWHLKSKKFLTLSYTEVENESLEECKNRNIQAFEGISRIFA
jgi:hypothetical protein